MKNVIKLVAVVLAVLFWVGLRKERMLASGYTVVQVPPLLAAPTENQQLVQCLAETPGSNFPFSVDSGLMETFVLSATTVELQLEYGNSIVGAFVVEHDGTIIGWQPRTSGTGVERKLSWEDYEFRRRQMLIHFC